eukprot:453758_1
MSASFWKQMLFYVHFVVISYSLRWEDGSPLPMGLDGAAIGTINDEVTYLIGGWNGAGQYLDTIYKWNISNNQSLWTKLSVTTPVKFGCWSQCSVTINNELIYIIGPLQDGEAMSADGIIYIFNTSNEQFIETNELIPTMPIKFRRSCIITDALNELIFVVGGRSHDYQIPYLQIFNLTTRQWLHWSFTNVHPFRVYWSMSCYFDDNKQLLYTFGGYGHENSQWRYFDEISIYDLNTHTWTISENQYLSVPRDNTHAVSLNKTVYIIGGYNNLFEFVAELSTVDIFDLNTQTIQPIQNGQNLNKTKGVISATIINQEIHVFGGKDPLTETWLNIHEIGFQTDAVNTVNTNSVFNTSITSTTITSTTITLPTTETVFILEEKHVHNIALIDEFGYMIMVLVFSLPVIICIIAMIFHITKRKGTDTPNYWSLFKFFGSIGDFYTDCIWAFTLYINYYDTNLWVYAFVFIIASHIVSIIVGVIFISNWRHHKTKK